VPAVGIAFPGNPLDPGTWSGTPLGVARGLEHAGATVTPLRAEAPDPVTAAAMHGLTLAHLRGDWKGARQTVREARRAARLSPLLGRLQSWGAGRALRAAGPLDGVVQIGTGYRMPEGVPVATLEDMTVTQVLEAPYLGWSRLSPKAVQKRIDEQRRAYERATACCTTTRWVARSIVEDYGIPAAKVHVVGLGHNHPGDPPERDWSVPRFLFVGIDWERKNGPGVLRAFARLRADVPEAELDVVGGHPPLDQPGVRGHGILPLGDPDAARRLAALFAAATCFVMPSHQEAAGLVYTEAGCAGLASIGSTSGGAPELVGDGGIVVDPDDDDALLAAMRSLADPLTAQELGAKALAHAATSSWPAVGDRLLRALALPL
jgi:glycosyltransferase involved in cell wall biosynthesis